MSNEVDEVRQDNLIRIGNLIYIEGPMMAAFNIKDTNRVIIFDHVDYNEAFNVWLMYEVSVSNLKDYIDKKISGWDLFNSKTGNTYLNDINREIMWHIRRIDEVPKIYEPDKHIFFDEEDTDDLEKLQKFIHENN